MCEVSQPLHEPEDRRWGRQGPDSVKEWLVPCRAVLTVLSHRYKHQCATVASERKSLFHKGSLPCTSQTDENSRSACLCTCCFIRAPDRLNQLSAAEREGQLKTDDGWLSCNKSRLTQQIDLIDATRSALHIAISLTRSSNGQKEAKAKARHLASGWLSAYPWRDAHRRSISVVAFFAQNAGLNLLDTVTPHFLQSKMRTHNGARHLNSVGGWDN